NIAVELFDVVPAAEERAAKDTARQRLVAAPREIDGVGLEEVARRVVDPGAECEITRRERAGRIDLVVAVLDVERDVAAVMRRPPLGADRREKVAGVGTG